MPSKHSQFVRSVVRSGVAHLCFERPPLNVMHIPLLHELAAALEELTANETVRVLILRAEGQTFSAGVDVADHTDEKVAEMIPLFDQVCLALTEFSVPTIAAVQGHALGGGCELVLCCDLAVLAESARIGQPEIHLGVFAPIAALRLPALIGPRAAADLYFTGRTLTAREACDLKLVNAVVPAEQVLPWAQEKAAHLAGLSRAALRIAKRVLHLGANSWAAHLSEVEEIYLQELMQTADAQEGINAFMEKRSPVWQHR